MSVEFFFSNEATESRAKLYSSDEDEEETPQQKRLRLAKEYLSQLEDEGFYIYYIFILLNIRFSPVIIEACMLSVWVDD